MEYMGDSRKYYTPDSFSNYSLAGDGINWMKSADIQFKSGDKIYRLSELEMPHDYEHGSRSEIYHVFTALAILLRLQGRHLDRQNMWREVSTLAKRSLKLPSGSTLDLDVNLQTSTLGIVTDPVFFPLLYIEAVHAMMFVSKPRVARNLHAIATSPKETRFVIQIGENRNVAIHDVKMFYLLGGSRREIHIDHKI